LFLALRSAVAVFYGMSDYKKKAQLLWCELHVDDDMLTPTGYSPATQQPIWPTAHPAHSQHCGHNALPPGQKTNARRRGML